MTAGGFAIIPSWMALDPDVPPAAIRVYLVLAAHIHRGGAWEMTHSQIAAECGYGRTTVIDALNYLRDLGVVSWTTPDPRDNRGCTYRIMVIDPSAGTDEGCPPDRTGGVRPTGQGVSAPPDTKTDSPQTPHRGGAEGAAPTLSLVGLPAEKAKTTRRKPSHPLPADWKPKPEHAALASRLGVDLATSAFTFRNYAAGRDWRMVDWDATFRNWVTRDAQRSDHPTSRPVRRDGNGRIREDY